MPSKVFTITPKHLITGLLAFIAVAVLGFTVIPEVFSAISAPKPAEIAAREGAQAFLSTNVEAGQGVWEDAVCEVASDESCEMLKKSLSPMLWPSVERGQMQRSCEAQSAKLLKDLPAENSQLWQVSLVCTDQGQISQGDVQIVVSEQQDGWKLERVLFIQDGQNENR
jgi:hypothetical protein